jgi:hypothetical protein
MSVEDMNRARSERARGGSLSALREVPHLLHQAAKCIESLVEPCHPDEVREQSLIAEQCRKTASRLDLLLSQDDEVVRGDIRVKQITQTSDACCSEWEGETIDSRPIYASYRWGYLSVRLGPVGGNTKSAIEGEEVFGAEQGHLYEGRIDWNNVCRITGIKMVP